MPDIAVIGGSGLYHIGDEFRPDIQGKNNMSDIARTNIADVPVVFLARHGFDHRFSPTDIPVEDNLRYLKRCGVRQIVSIFSCGSLQLHIQPHDFVIPDQILDRTTHRPRGLKRMTPSHTEFADPYDKKIGEALINAYAVVMPAYEGEKVWDVLNPNRPATIHTSSTVAVIEGPRFNTKAESQALHRDGAHIVTMTQMPEAIIARELGMRYASIGLVTDFDAGILSPTHKAVTFDEVQRVVRVNTRFVQVLLMEAIPRLAK